MSGGFFFGLQNLLDGVTGEGHPRVAALIYFEKNRVGLDLNHGADDATDGSNAIVLLDTADECLSLLAFFSLTKDAEENHHQDEGKEHEHEEASAAVGRDRLAFSSGTARCGSHGDAGFHPRERWPLLPESQERTVWRDEGDEVDRVDHDWVEPSAAESGPEPSPCDGTLDGPSTSGNGR